MNEKPGYHLNEIPKGELGESSKILEEVLELQDAEKQGIKIMALCELADIYGAMMSYLRTKHPGVTMMDIENMACVTERAFMNGRRK